MVVLSPRAQSIITQHVPIWVIEEAFKIGEEVEQVNAKSFNMDYSLCVPS